MSDLIYYSLTKWLSAKLAPVNSQSMAVSRTRFDCPGSWTWEANSRIHLYCRSNSPRNSPWEANSLYICATGATTPASWPREATTQYSYTPAGVYYSLRASFARGAEGGFIDHIRVTGPPSDTWGAVQGGLENHIRAGTVSIYVSAFFGHV